MPDQDIQYRLIGSDGIEYGPVTADDVRAWIREGRASAKTMVHASDNPAWRKLGELPEFAEAIALRAANASGGSSAPEAAPKPEQNKMARTGFILSIVSLLCCCVPLAPFGLVISTISLVRIKDGKGLKEGYNFALAGIVISVLVIIMNLVFLHYLPKLMSGAGSQKVFGP